MFMIFAIILTALIVFLRRCYFNRCSNHVDKIVIAGYDKDEKVYYCSFRWRGMFCEGFIIEADHEIKTGNIVGYDATLKRWHIVQKK